MVTLDLHAPQVQGFFKIPVDDLYAMPVLCDVVTATGLGDLVVVSPDAGFAKRPASGQTACVPRWLSPRNGGSIIPSRPKSSS